MSHNKVKQEKEAEMTFQEVEAGQIRNVHEIEMMYERKCAIIQEKLLNLEQSTL